MRLEELEGGAAARDGSDDVDEVDEGEDECEEPQDACADQTKPVQTQSDSKRTCIAPCDSASAHFKPRHHEFNWFLI